VSEQQASDWSPGPRGPRAGAGVVEVWRADLTAAPADLHELLCHEELERAQRIVRTGARALWTRSRGLLRALLGRYLECDPRELRFELGPHGKPKLAGNGRADLDLRFNLSHSGPLVLVAVSADHEVGVDVEHRRARGGDGAHELALAARIFGMAEAQRLGELDRGRRAGELLRAWALHEATLKCLGTGLGGTRPSSPDAPDGLWTATLDVGPGAAAAVAAQGAHARELRCWDWVDERGLSSAG
jgi:4'-phosphopantetheinyl transferase